MSMYKEYQCIFCREFVEEKNMVCYKNDDQKHFGNVCRSCNLEMNKKDSRIDFDIFSGKNKNHW